MKILKLAYNILAVVFVYFAYSFYDEYKIKANKKPEKPRVISQEDIKKQNEYLLSTIVEDKKIVYFYDKNMVKRLVLEPTGFSRIVYGKNKDGNCIVQDFFGDYKNKKEQSSVNIVDKNDCDNFRTNNCKNNIAEVNQIGNNKIFSNSIKAFFECRDEKIYGIFWVKLSFDISGFDYYGFDLHHSDDKILMHDKNNKALVEVYRKQDLLNDSKAYKIIIYGNNDEVAVFDLDEEEKPHIKHSYIYEKDKITARHFSKKEFKKYTGSLFPALQKYLNKSKELVPANQKLKKHNHNSL